MEQRLPEFGLCHCVVMNMMQPYLDRQHHVYFDRLFARSKLTDDLAQRGTYRGVLLLYCDAESTGPTSWGKENEGRTVWRSRVPAERECTPYRREDKRHVSVLSTNSNAEMIAVGNLHEAKAVYNSALQRTHGRCGSRRSIPLIILQGWATIKEVVVLCILVSVGCHHGEHLDNLHAHSTEMTQKQFFF